MKLTVQLLFTFFVYFVTSVQAENNSTASPPQPFLGLQSLETNFKIKNDLFGRFIKLLFRGSVTTKGTQPESNPNNENRSSLLLKPFRRLNIFGLQSEPEAPIESLDGGFKGPAREIIHITKNPEDQLSPSFFVVSPTSSIDIRSAALTSQYPKLSFDQIGSQGIDDDSLQVDFFKSPNRK